MANDADNLVWGKLESLRTLIASTAAFQTLTGTADVTAAKAHIYIPGVENIGTEKTIQNARPFAVVDDGDKFTLNRNGTSGYFSDGSLLLMIEADVPDDKRGDDKLEDAHKWFLLAVGDTLQQAMEASLDPASGYIYITRIEKLSGPARADKSIYASEGDFYQIVFMVHWGIHPS